MQKLFLKKKMNMNINGGLFVGEPVERGRGNRGQGGNIVKIHCMHK
jgi:hypothetical protein